MAVYNIVFKVAPYPPRMPVFRLEETDFKPSNFALQLFLPALFTVDDGSVHLPPAAVTAIQRFSLVGNIQHLARLHLFRIPHVAHTFACILLCRRYNYAIPLLHHIVRRRLILPAKTRLGSGNRLATVLHLHSERRYTDSAATSSEQHCQNNSG